MNKNTIIYLVIFLALAITATLLLLKKSESTLPHALTDFAVDDTASITKLHLTDHFKNDITLQRKGQGIWMVNNQYKVKQSNIQVLLETIKEVRVKNPVPIPARENVIKDLAVNGIKVEIYKGTDLAKTYFVGSSTADDEGTYMYIQGSSEPFVTHIPGFVGYLTTRYITKVQDWRSTEIYHLNPADIKEVSVNYTNHPDNSFTLKASGTGFVLLNAQGQQTKMNQLIAKKYVVGFRAINFETFPIITQKEQDSILSGVAFAVINVSTTNQKLPVLKLYSKYADIKTKDIGENNADLNHMYGIIGDNSKEIVLIQTYVIGKLLAHYGDLASGKATMLGK
jgi:hypothetical protein